MELALIGRLVAACIVIAVVLGGLQVVASRLGRVRLATGSGGGGRLISLVESTYLPGSASVHVVRIAERYYAVGRNAATMSTLAEIPSDEVERWLGAERAIDPNPIAPVLRFASRLRGGK